MTECETQLPYEFDSPRRLVVQFSDLELSSDAGLLLARQAEEQVQICRRLANGIQELLLRLRVSITEHPEFQSRVDNLILHL